MLAYPCISIINPRGSIICYLLQIYWTLTLLETQVNNVKFMPLWNLYSSGEDGNWTTVFSWILSLQACDVFDNLTPIIYSHPLWLPVLKKGFFGVLWVIPKALPSVCLSNSSNGFANSKFPLLNPFRLMMFGIVYISWAKLAHQILASGL